MKKNNSTETKGLTVENQTKGLNSVNNGSQNVYDTMVSNSITLNGKWQEVLIRCKKDVVVSLLNNILENVGESMKLSPTDDWERISEVHNRMYLHSLNQHHLLGNSSHQFNSNDESSILSLDRLYYSKMEAVLEFNVYSGNSNMWSEIIKSYPNVEWIVDHYSLPKAHIGSTLMEYKGGEIKIQEFDIEHIDELEEKRPNYAAYKEIMRIRDLVEELNALTDDWGYDLVSDESFNDLMDYFFDMSNQDDL